MKALLALVFMAFTSVAYSATIQAVHYDPTYQQLHVLVTYQGGSKAHNFHLEWDDCQNLNGHQTIAVRLIDSGWDDTGTTEYHQALQFDMGSMHCKPAHLTIRSGRYSHGTVFIGQ